MGLDAHLLQTQIYCCKADRTLGITLHRFTNYFYLYLVTWEPRQLSVATRVRTGRPWFDSRQGLGIFFFATASRAALGSTQRLIQWLPGCLSSGIKRSMREDDHSSPSSAVRIRGAIPPLTHTSSSHRIHLHGVVPRTTLLSVNIHRIENVSRSV
jgi:hypothetical protein